MRSWIESTSNESSSDDSSSQVNSGKKDRYSTDRDPLVTMSRWRFGQNYEHTQIVQSGNFQLLIVMTHNLSHKLRFIVLFKLNSFLMRYFNFLFGNTSHNLFKVGNSVEKSLNNYKEKYVKLKICQIYYTFL